MSKQNLNCAKCQQVLNYLPYHSYAEPPALKSKEGHFYCFDCFKSISHCKVCGKSAAQMDINIHDKKTWYQPWEKIYFREVNHIKPFDMCGRYCDFFCSPKCLTQDDNRNSELKRNKNLEKLQKGWKYCEDCAKLFKELFAERKTQKEIEEAMSYFSNVIPSEEKICEIHKRNREKDRYVNQVIYPKAQKWWDSLTYEDKLAEVKKLDIHWITAEKRSATHEEVTNQKEVPPFIISQKFQHKEPCISCGKTWKCVSEINCGKNFPNGKPSYCASCPSSNGGNGNSTENNTKDNHNGFINEIESKKNQLQRLKENKGEKSEEVHRLEQEIQALLQSQDQKRSSTNGNLTKNKIITLSVIGFALLSLIGSTIYVSKAVKPKKPKIK